MTIPSNELPQIRYDLDAYREGSQHPLREQALQTQEFLTERLVRRVQEKQHGDGTSIDTTIRQRPDSESPIFQEV